MDKHRRPWPTQISPRLRLTRNVMTIIQHYGFRRPGYLLYNRIPELNNNNNNNNSVSAVGIPRPKVSYIKYIGQNYAQIFKINMTKGAQRHLHAT